MNMEEAFKCITDELEKSHLPFDDCRDNWSTIREEIDRLWKEVDSPNDARKRCAKIAATTIRFMMNLPSTTKMGD